MVMSEDARKDVESVLTKVITYRKINDSTTDLAYDYVDKSKYTDYEIKAQATIQRLNDRFVMLGIVKEGDLVGLFRYMYDKDAHNNSINPILIPKKGDKILFNGLWFVIKTCSPLTSEDEGIIAWEFTAGQTS